MGGWRFRPDRPAHSQGRRGFVDRLAISRGLRVLDVACGTGNLSYQQRARVRRFLVSTSTNLVEQACQRAAGEGLQANFEEGDAEQLPYPDPDAQFDLVISMFGAMFAPRSERGASELARV